MSDIPGSHPSVDEAIRTAHHGHGKGASPEHGLSTATHGKGASVVGQPDPLVDGQGMKGYGEIRSGQKGYPGTD